MQSSFSPPSAPAGSVAHPGAPSTQSRSGLVEGPRWYRSRIRWFGPIVALVIPGVVGALAYGSLRLSEAPWSGAVGLIGGYFAAPALLAVGAPFGEREIYPLAVLASAVMWLLIGVLAARRATRNPMATWGDFWRHYLWMLGGIWVGVGIAIAIATVQVGSNVVDW